MRSIILPSRSRWLGMLLFVALASSLPAQVFLLDTNQSSITITGNMAGLVMKEQGPGSLSTKYAGTLQATVAGNTIQFSGGSSITALNTGDWQPKSDGTVGAEPANYGAQAANFLATARAALRNLRLDAFSGVITLTNSQFESSGISFQFLTNNPPGILAYNVTGFLNESGSYTLTGYATNGITTRASLESSGGEETLTIPVNATFTMSLINTNDSTIYLQGQLLARRSTAAPPLKVESVELSGNSLTLRWKGEPGQQFTIYSSSDLSTWETNTPALTPQNGEYSWTVPVDRAARFLRLSK